MVDQQSNPVGKITAGVDDPDAGLVARVFHALIVRQQLDQFALGDALFNGDGRKPGDAAAVQRQKLDGEGVVNLKLGRDRLVDELAVLTEGPGGCIRLSVLDAEMPG